MKKRKPTKAKKAAAKKAARKSSSRDRAFALKRTAMTQKKAAKAELQYLPWHQVELEDINPLFQRQLIVGQEVMLARVLLKKGCIVPLHSHVNEQLTYILEGALKFLIE